MSFKDLLVVIEEAEAVAGIAPLAYSLANQFDAHLTVAGVMAGLAPVSPFFGEFPLDIIETVQAAAAREMDGAFATFEKAGATANSCAFIRISGAGGAAAENLARAARRYDLTVMVQPNRAEKRGDPAYFEAALFKSGRPVLIAPYVLNSAPSFKNVLVAWDGGAAAARALSAAMPFLKQADTVELITMSAKASDNDALPGIDITQHLARHGVNAQLTIRPKSKEVGEMLLSHAADSGANLLVMGGYGHSRLREIVLGGATRSIVASMTLPVLMAH